MAEYLLPDKYRSGNKLCGAAADCLASYPHNIFYREYSLSGQNFRNRAAWIIEISSNNLLISTLECAHSIQGDFLEVAKTY
nr:hypothetical protein [Acetobacter syzygii]